MVLTWVAWRSLRRSHFEGVGCPSRLAAVARRVRPAAALGEGPEFLLFELSASPAAAWWSPPDRPRAGRWSESRSAGRRRSMRQTRAAATIDSEPQASLPASSAAATDRALVPQGPALPATR